MGLESQVRKSYIIDASINGYGQCTYLRLVNKCDQVHCSFAVGKSWVTPLKNITVSRLELTAALVSTKVSSVLWQEPGYEIVKELLWTDSQMALDYIRLKHRIRTTSSEKSSTAKTSKAESSLSIKFPAITCTVDELHHAEIVILRLLQSEVFEKEIRVL